MRRIVACVAAAIAATAIASPAQAQGPRDCYEEYLRDGKSVEVFCDEGRPGSFQAVGHCHTPLASWDVHGSIGRVRGTSSFVECNALLGPVWIEGYHVRWF
ncbi:hypothetical protein [Lentzea sp. NPDC051838]|uniref:hypothetical protein n=1 Tax=Lentzea sp. NPDC051838 TaxID=3154849 RepID=UPI00341AF7F8